MKNFEAILIAVCAASILLLSGCTRTASANIDPGPAKVESAPDPNSAQVEHPELFPVVEAEARTAHPTLSVNGVVAPDVSRTVPVNALSGGRVIQVLARLGDMVKKGDVLLRIQSADLAQALADYQKTKSDESLARRSLERAQTLYEHGALAQKDLQIAEETENKARIDVGAVEQRIKILSGDLKTLSPIVDVIAPASGVIVEQNIQSGAGVKSLDNSPNLFTIADLSHVWILCDVYENNLAEVHAGDTADVHLNAYPNRVFRAKVSNIGNILDQQTRAAKVRLELENPAGIMRPGMFASAVFTSQTTEWHVTIPATAVLRLHDRDWIFRPLDGHNFRRMEVQAGATDPDGKQEILAGLRPGDRVVANALQFSTAAEQKP